ncbi:MAG: type II toxin-antitoxin system HicB family antitoxin [Chloroflexota bacterium]
MKHEFTAVFERGDGDWWIATALEIPGAFSQGKTIEEAREMLMDAIHELMLAEREEAERELAGKPDIIRETLTIELE